MQVYIPSPRQSGKGSSLRGKRKDEATLPGQRHKFIMGLFVRTRNQTTYSPDMPYRSHPLCPASGVITEWYGRRSLAANTPRVNVGCSVRQDTSQSDDEMQLSPTL